MDYTPKAYVRQWRMDKQRFRFEILVPPQRPSHAAARGKLQSFAPVDVTAFGFGPYVPTRVPQQETAEPAGEAESPAR